MAYNRRNKLTLIVDIQELTKQHTTKGVSQQWVFDNLIKTTYRISRRTYYTYLATPAKFDLKKMEANKKMQLNLF